MDELMTGDQCQLCDFGLYMVYYSNLWASNYTKVFSIDRLLESRSNIGIVINKIHMFVSRILTFVKTNWVIHAINYVRWYGKLMMIDISKNFINSGRNCYSFIITEVSLKLHAPLRNVL